MMMSFSIFLVSHGSTCLCATGSSEEDNEIRDMIAEEKMMRWVNVYVRERDKEGCTENAHPILQW